MKFSIIIPNWNGKGFLGTCLNSLQKQSFRDLEIIVVDNGSTDGSVEFIKDNYPEVKITPLDRNYGFSKAINEGVKKAKGEFVFLLNNDTEVDSNCLFECECSIQNHPDISMFALRIMNYERRNIMDSGGTSYPKSGRSYDIGVESPFSEMFNKEKEVFGFCAGAAVIRRSVFQKTGYFDEDFFAYFEDVDFGFRARLLGHKCLYIPNAVVYHIHSGYWRTASKVKIYYLHRNVLWTIVKNWPLSLIAKYSPVIIFHDILATLYCLFFEHSFVTLKAKIDAIKYLPIMLEKRKWIQKNKKISVKEIERWLEAPEKPLKIFKRKKSSYPSSHNEKNHNR